MAPLSKAQQDAEAIARTNAGVVPGEGAHALDVIDDGGAAPSETGAIPAPADRDAAPQRPLPPAKSNSDNRRDAIVAKFRTDRTTAANDQRDDISDFTRSGMPPEFAENNAPVVEQPQHEELAPVVETPVVDARPQPAADAPKLPQRVKIKIRGEEREVSLEELIAKGQVAYAADDYLDEAKSKLGEVNTLLQQTKHQAPRPSQDPQHPEDPQRAQTAEPAQGDPASPQHPEDKLGKLIETLQFGDPEDAKVQLRDTIAAEAQTVVTQTLERQRFQDEGARTAKVLKDFEQAHPEIANDKKARAAIETEVFDLQVEDIKALGVDPNTIRPDGMPPTPGDIALAHRWYRTKGFKVTAPGELLEKATEKFMEWKGVKPAAETPTPAAPATPAQPRIDVTVDRTARRAAIPQQPNRTATPSPAAAQRPAQPRDRGAIVKGMIQTRNAPRGRVLV